MPGAVDVDLGLDDSALDTEFSIGGTELLLFKQMGKATVDGIQLRFMPVRWRCVIVLQVPEPPPRLQGWQWVRQ